jgi:hypothetical protein
VKLVQGERPQFPIGAIDFRRAFAVASAVWVIALDELAIRLLDLHPIRPRPKPERRISREMPPHEAHNYSSPV